MRSGLEDARRWMARGTDTFLAAAVDLDEDGYRGATLLPGWTRKHLVAHVAANGEALGRLVHWAATGRRTPMYSSSEQRAADIEAGSRLPGSALKAWVARSAGELECALDRLTSEQWGEEVVTGQGRTVRASVVPWMRAREVWVHAVDLASGIGFTDLPADFLVALGTDVVSKRGASRAPAVLLEATDVDARWLLAGDGGPMLVHGALSELVAYLTGRPHDLHADEGGPVPELGPWL